MDYLNEKETVPTIVRYSLFGEAALPLCMCIVRPGLYRRFVVCAAAKLAVAPRQPAPGLACVSRALRAWPQLRCKRACLTALPTSLLCALQAAPAPASRWPSSPEAQLMGAEALLPKPAPEPGRAGAALGSSGWAAGRH